MSDAAICPASDAGSRAISAVAVRGPIPGMVINRRAVSGSPARLDDRLVESGNPDLSFLAIGKSHGLPRRLEAQDDARCDDREGDGERRLHFEALAEGAQRAASERSL